MAFWVWKSSLKKLVLDPRDPAISAPAFPRRQRPEALNPSISLSLSSALRALTSVPLKVTATLPCLWDLHAQLRSERDRGRAEIQHLGCPRLM